MGLMGLFLDRSDTPADQQQPGLGYSTVGRDQRFYDQLNPLIQQIQSGKPLTQEQRQTLYDTSDKVGGARGSLSDLFIKETRGGLSDQDLLNQVMTQFQSAAYPGADTFADVAKLGASAIVGGAAGSALSGGAAASVEAPTGTAAAGGTAASGGGAMDVLDMFGSTSGAPAFSTDAGLWGSSAAGAADPTVLDMFGSTADTPGWSSSPAAWDPASMSIPGAGGGIWESILHGLGALGGGVSNLFGTALGGGGASVGSITPGLLALAYAARQPGVDTSSLRGVIDELSGNQNAVVRAATDPVQANIASGYGDLTQRLASRGVLGSSFGNTDISNYLTAGDRSLGDVGATAAQKALGLRGDLASNLATLSATSQEIKNNLYGRAFDVLGRGLNPSGYAGNINIGGAPGGGGGGNPLGFLGGLLGAGSGLFGKIGDLFKGGGSNPVADTAGAGDLMNFGSNFA